MQDVKLVAASAIALAVTLVAIFTMRPLAPRLGLMDKPGERKRHRGRIPLIGGLCFFAGTLAGLLYLGYLDRFLISLMIASALIVVTGLVDDLSNLGVRTRLIVQACAAGLVIVATGVHIDTAGHLFGSDELRLGLLGIPLTMIAVIGLINAFNMMDGIDGLAGGLAMVSIAAILVYTGAGWPAMGVVMLLQILFVALIPYLSVNMGWPDGRKVFMGDAGSTLIGFLLAWSLIYLSQHSIARLAPADVLWCAALPIMDTLAVMARRVRVGQSPFNPDRRHLHHLLLDTGLAPRPALAVMLAAGGLLAMIGYALRGIPEWVNLVVFAAILALYMQSLERTLAWARQASGPLFASIGRRQAVMGREVQPVAVAAVRLPANPARQAAAHRIASIASIDPARDGIQAVRGSDVQRELPTHPGTGSAMFGRALSPPLLSPVASVRVLCIFDTAQDAIKMAPVARLLSLDERFETRICVAAHAERKSDQVLRLFDLESDFDLNVPPPDRDMTDIASASLGEMKRILGAFCPDVVLVHGDTPTVVGAAMAACYQQIPVVRVGADAAEGSSSSCLAEEANRKIAATLAALNFTSADLVVEDLIAAGVPAERIVVSGNTAIETLAAAAAHIERDASTRADLERRFSFLRAGSPLLLVTGRDSQGNGVERIVRTLRRVAQRRPDVDIVCPVHSPCPAGGTRLHTLPNLHFIETPEYLTYVYLLDRAYLVLADCVDIEQEAALLGKPVLLPHEIDKAGVAADEGDIRQLAMLQRAVTESVLAVLDNQRVYQAMRLASQPGNDHDACARIIEALAKLPSHAPKLAA